MIANTGLPVTYVGGETAAALGTEGITSNKEVEYIWKRDGKVIKYDMFNLEDMEGLSPEGEKIITYSVTIKAKQTE